MPLVALSHVSMSYGAAPVLSDVTVEVEKGARIGVLGQNGAGKSTLLRLLGGALEPTAGEVTRQRGVRVGYQAQEMTCDPASTVLAETRALFAGHFERERRMREIEERLAEADPALLAEYERLQREHEAGSGYGVERRIESTLLHLGIERSMWERPLGGFSGGERNVLGLARVLLSDPDVMLLDEPSNHLDMDGVEWFLEFVRASPAAVVMVSHNRHLLDALATGIWEVGGGGVRRWTGNYTAFVRQKAEALALQERQWKAQQRTVARIEFQARRMLDMANAYDAPGQARRAKAMLRRIERMDRVDRPDDGLRRFAARLSPAERHGRIALQVKGFSLAFGERRLFDQADLEIEYGERVCLVGPNGSGKSTLFRRILDEGGWENPVLRLGKAVRVGEYRQLHDSLDPALTLLQWACAATGLERTPAAALLHRFLFTFDDLDRTIGTLSGGEKSRLQLAKLVHERVNLLLLDEPTNHLDIQACEQLEEMLQEFPGTLFVISHDRYFLDRLVTRVVEVAGGRLVSHPFGFAEWWRRRRESGAGRRAALEERETRARDEEARVRSLRERETKKARQREQNRLRVEARELEGRIEALEAQRRELETALAGVWSGAEGPRRAAQLGRELGACKDSLEDLYRRWEEVAGSLE